MGLSKKESENLIRELTLELSAKPDGSGKNLIVPVCPYCHKSNGKFGIYIGKETDRKKPFMSHCFSCHHSTFTLDQLLTDIGRPDLIVSKTVELDAKLETNILFKINDETDSEIDDSLQPVDLPEWYKRCFSNQYLRERHFTYDDFEFFQVGTTRGFNLKYDDYVIFPIIDNEVCVGYVSRHTWPKEDIDAHNRSAKRNGEYMIMRYRNSTDNEFVKLLYNYDAIIEDETDTVILVEGVFDVVSLTRKLDLYDNTRVAVVATFGKKISLTQIYKIQSKGVKTVVISYDGDAVDSIKKASDLLKPYFDVFIADIQDSTQDVDSMDFWDIYDLFSERLKTPLQYKLTKIQE